MNYVIMFSFPPSHENYKVDIGVGPDTIVL